MVLTIFFINRPLIKYLVSGLSISFMIRHIITLTALLVSLNLKAQCELNFTVMDAQTGTSMPYASIIRKNSSEGLYSDVDGIVSVNFSQCSEKDSVIISALGFNDTIVGIKSIRPFDTIGLSPNAYDLTSITISAKRDIDYKSQYIFFPQKKTFTSIASNLCDSYLFAQYVSFDEDGISGYISSVDIYLARFFKNSDPFRINLLEYDTETEAPGLPLIHESLVVNKAKNGWNKVDVQKYRIPIPKEGIFIVFERLTTSMKDKRGKNHHSLGWISRRRNRATTFIKVGDQPWTIPTLFEKTKNEILVRVKANVEKKD